MKPISYFWSNKSCAKDVLPPPFMSRRAAGPHFPSIPILYCHCVPATKQQVQISPAAQLGLFFKTIDLGGYTANPPVSIQIFPYKPLENLAWKRKVYILKNQFLVLYQ